MSYSCMAWAGCDLSLYVYAKISMVEMPARVIHLLIYRVSNFRWRRKTVRDLSFVSAKSLSVEFFFFSVCLAGPGFPRLDDWWHGNPAPILPGGTLSRTGSSEKAVFNLADLKSSLLANLNSTEVEFVLNTPVQFSAFLIKNILMLLRFIDGDGKWRVDTGLIMLIEPNYW